MGTDFAVPQAQRLKAVGSFAVQCCGSFLSKKTRNLEPSDFKTVGLKPWPQPDGAVAFFFPRTLWDHTGAPDLRRLALTKKAPAEATDAGASGQQRGKGTDFAVPQAQR
jgi:hypothetical protein